MDYKATLNLPRTDFPMKANLPQREPVILKDWEDNNIYKKILDNRKKAKKFILHDGPPYANGDIHIGHVLNKTLKDIVIKYKTMRGFYSPYVPGWDCHGLPVEHQLFKVLNMTKAQIGQVEFRKKAFDYAMKYVDIQRDQFRRLGIFGDWENPYLTLDRGYEAEIVRSFAKLVKKGFMYKGLKPVNWCGVCETALAEAEVEYNDHTSPSVYVKFKVLDGEYKDAFFVIWTTTPWTLVANVAVALHPDLEYAVVDREGEKWILLKSLAGALMEKLGIQECRILKTAAGSQFDGIKCAHPFIDRKSKVVLADYVSHEEGTGCVHTAPGHGQEDYITGLKYKLPMIMPVDKKGRFDDMSGEFAGMHVHKANEAIINRLRTDNALILSEDIRHSYPHCWRCKKPIIFRATEQWFMGIDHNKLRRDMLDVIAKKIKWVPPVGKDRISSMVKNRPDWCLSRQRYWGVPIIAFYCLDCNEVLLDHKVIEHVASLFEKEGTDIWFEKDPAELLPNGSRCKKCKGGKFTKEMDIVDVWFDSGVSHQAVLKTRKDLDFPCDLYLEGSDQHRGWFQSSLITSMGIEQKSPFDTVLTHGFVVDGEGKKMSKSLGNVVSPHDVIKDYGVDILRLWVASSDYSEDIKISKQILERLADAYRKVRNTYRYMLGNLNGFDPEKDCLPVKDMLEIDRWALSEASKLLDSATEYYEEFAFHKVFHSVYNFCVLQMSSFYLDILKDRLYIFGTKSAQRRSAQTALFEIFNLITKVMAPIAPFTTEEAWKSFYKNGKADSVHIADWPEIEKFKEFYDPELDDKWRVLGEVRSEVLKELERKRESGLIGSGLEARVYLSSDDAALRELLAGCRDQLNSIFIVSQAEVVDGLTGDCAANDAIKLCIKVEKASGQKCRRCWNYSDYVGKDNTHSDLCERCVDILKGGASDAG